MLKNQYSSLFLQKTSFVITLRYGSISDEDDHTLLRARLHLQFPAPTPHGNEYPVSRYCKCWISINFKLEQIKWCLIPGSVTFEHPREGNFQINNSKVPVDKQLIAQEVIYRICIFGKFWIKWNNPIKPRRNKRKKDEDIVRW